MHTRDANFSIQVNSFSAVLLDEQFVTIVPPKWNRIHYEITIHLVTLYKDRILFFGNLYLFKQNFAKL